MTIIPKKYEIIEYSVGGRTEYGINKRFLLFFSKRLIHHKHVRGAKMPSREILTWRTLAETLAEIKLLKNGIQPIIQRYFENGIMVAQIRKDDI